MSRIQCSLSIIFIALLLVPTFAQEPTDSKPKLRLFIHGGGTLSDASREAFIEMAGGKVAHLVVIPAPVFDDLDLPKKPQLSEAWENVGIEKVTVLHTSDPAVTNDPEFLKPLETATAVWIGGGSRGLSNSYAQTAVETKLREMANRGIVVGGTAAGAAIMARVMINGGLDTPRLRTGINLLPNAIIDHNFLERSRLNRLTRAVESYPQRTGIGISEGTALVVNGVNAKVIGRGFVISIRKLGERQDIRSFPPGSEFSLKSLNLVPQELPVELIGLPGTAELFSNKDELVDFLIKAATEAEKFRQAFIASDELEPKSISLAKLVQRFTAAHAEEFETSVEQFRDGFRGTLQKLDPEQIYAPFAGQWQGRWADQTVRHHWSDIVKPDREASYRLVEPGGRKQSYAISSYQYSWIGDGYGLNMVANATRRSGKRHYLLGYVEHLKDGDLAQVTTRRPHVGIHAGEGRLVWVTEKEVFFEEAIPDPNGQGHDTYSIIGFRYETSNKSLTATERFKTLYKRIGSETDKLQEFESFKLSIEQARERVVPAQQ